MWEACMIPESPLKITKRRRFFTRPTPVSSFSDRLELRGWMVPHWKTEISVYSTAQGWKCKMAEEGVLFESRSKAEFLLK